MVEYQCTNCKYKGSTVDPKKPIPRRCPYCSKEGTLVRTKKANDFIKEVDNMLDEG